MKRAVLKDIKEDLKFYKDQKKELREALDEVHKDVQREYELAQAKIALEPNTEKKLGLLETACVARKHEHTERIKKTYDVFYSDHEYTLIYADGTEVNLTALAIMRGEKFPKLSGIVYAIMYADGVFVDTEHGELDFFSDERMEKAGYGERVEVARQYDYLTAIRSKYITEWSLKYRAEHREFVVKNPSFYLA